MFSIHKPIASAGISALCLIGSAGAAMASNNPVSVGATVNQSITVTGFSGSVTFPAANPGTNATAPGEVFTVDSNDAAGLNIVTDLTGDLKGSADNYDLSSHGGMITVSGTAGGSAFTTYNLTSGGGTEYGSTAIGTGVINVSDTWSLAIPTNAPAESYAGNVNYAVFGN